MDPAAGPPANGLQAHSWLMDMDGVLVYEDQPVAGADRFLGRLQELGLPFLVLTNNSIYTPRDLAARLRLVGLDVPEHALGKSSAGTSVGSIACRAAFSGPGHPCS